jgi:serine O-acetyltransferase
MNLVLVLSHRVAHALFRMRVPLLPTLIALCNRFTFGCWIGPGARIGRRVSFGYWGLGIVIHDRAVLGDDVRIGTGVVIGGRSKHSAVPVIGDRCVISAGAKILGPLTIGDDAVVGANAVVISNVDARTVVGGVPARVLKRDISIADYHDGIERAA